MQLIVLAIALSLLVLFTWKFRNQSFVISVFIYLVIGSCFGHPFWSFDLGPIPLTFDRIFVMAMFAQFCYLYLQREERLSMHSMLSWFKRIDFVFLVYLIYLTYNVGTSDPTYRGLYPLSQLMFYYFAPAVVYVMIRQMQITEFHFYLLTAMLAVFGIYLALTGFAESREWAWAVFPRYIADTKITEFLGRARGPFLNPISGGIVQTICLCGLLCWWPRVQRSGKLVIIILAMVMALGIYFTKTRSVWLGAAASMGCMAWIFSDPRQRGALVCLGTIMIVGVFGAREQLSSFKRDKEVSVTQMAESAKLRPMLAAVAFKMSMDKPVRGFGLGQYKKHHHGYLMDGRFQMPLQRVRVFIQHNTYLAALVELGIIGLALHVTMMLMVTWLGITISTSDMQPLWVRQAGTMLLVLMIAFFANGMFHDAMILPMGTAFLFTSIAFFGSIGFQHLRGVRTDSSDATT